MHKFGKRALLMLGATACPAAPFAASRAQDPGPKGQPLTTEARVRSAGWWPTKSTPQREEHVGPAACAECHSSEASAQETTPMAEAGVPAANSKILAAHQWLNFRLGTYVYDLTRAEGGSILSVSDGTRSVSNVLGWAFGEGEVGETYVFERGGDYYESHLSYFRALQALDITPGPSGSTPSDLEEALGRQMDAEETHLCFGCHNTASSAGGKFDPDRLIPGVTCEACHGPGAKHVSAMKRGRIAEGLAHVLNPARLDPIDSVDFCGACHRAWADVLEHGTFGVATVRFQPFRLETSRCWGKGDARLTCLACHDPHQPLVHDPGSYDNRCLRCHLVTKGSRGEPDHPGAACPQTDLPRSN